LNFNIFDKNYSRYEKWFEKYSNIYKSELESLNKLKPEGLSCEIGIGSGRFSEPLGVNYGIDPSFKMLKIAKKRKHKVAQAKAEYIPFKPRIFDWVLIVTTFCFLDNYEKFFNETKKILKSKSKLLLGIVDKKTPLGETYLKNKHRNPFYKNAKFFSSEQILELFDKNNFKLEKSYQTIFGPHLRNIYQEPIDGFGKGGFVAFKFSKKIN